MEHQAHPTHVLGGCFQGLDAALYVQCGLILHQCPSPRSEGVRVVVPALVKPGGVRAQCEQHPPIQQQFALAISLQAESKDWLVVQHLGAALPQVNCALEVDLQNTHTAQHNAFLQNTLRQHHHLFGPIQLQAQPTTGVGCCLIHHGHPLIVHWAVGNQCLFCYCLLGLGGLQSNFLQDKP